MVTCRVFGCECEQEAVDEGVVTFLALLLDEYERDEKAGAAMLGEYLVLVEKLQMGKVA